MARPRKPPAILVTVNVRKSGKLAALPSDTARLGFFYVVLPEAKQADTPGQFVSVAHFKELAGRFARYADDYLRVGILERAGKLCERCAPRWTGLKAGSLVVHDWHDHQYDPRKLERQHAYQERLDDLDPGDDEPEFLTEYLTQNPRVSDAISDEKPGVSDAISDAISDADSRAQVRGGAPDRVGPDASNTERRTTNGISSGEDRSPSGAREDIAALLERPGWTKVTRAQRKVLNEVLGRHDRTGARFAAEVIRHTPADKDPLDAVMTADRMWQDSQRRKAEAEEQAWSETKEADRVGAGERVAWLEGQVAGRG